ncbi:MAG TPA: cytochrome c biogenesis heme-transporting ATPase CcmA [Gammaproteobacteria bacterium]|nr:cytochrome c biogenesis heme-transporting ATPase CcmA [Gammaproteobacteria bacterium]
MELQARGVACIRDDRILFQDLSFRVSEGEVLLLEGRNGSGKTSLLRILCGIRMPDEGEIAWNGEDIFRLGPDYHADMAYVGHRDGIKLDLTTSENLDIARGLGEPRADFTVEQALEQVDLGGYEDVPARSLSAGQQRRLALARLLVTQARLWILDEPFTSLDTHGIGVVERLFTGHLADGGMLAVTSHHAVHIETANVHRINLSA